MSGETSQKMTWINKLQCLGIVLFVIFVLPLILVLDIPIFIAKWIVERRDGFTIPTPEQVAEFSRRMLAKTEGDVVTVDGTPHPISWIRRDERDMEPNFEIHTTDGWTFDIDTNKFVVTRMFPNWWFSKVGLRVNYKDVA